MPLPAEILNTLPEDIRGSEHIAAFNDVGSLVKDFIGAKTADWRTGLPEDLRAEKSIEAFKTPAEVAKAFVETKKLVGQTLRPPTADAPDEEWEKFFKAGGKPNSPEEYKFTAPEGALSKEEEKNIREAAYRLGLNGRQVQKMIDFHTAGVAESQRLERQELEKTDKHFQDKWAANYGKNRALVGRVLDRIDPEKTFRAALGESGLGNNPALIEGLLAVSGLFIEKGLISGDVEGVASREEAAMKIKAITNDLEHPYHTSKAGDPAFEEMKKLHQLAYD